MADTPTIYPFDPTGLATGNRITGEQHVLTGAGSPNFNILVPTFAPYFPDSNMVVTARATDGTVSTWKEGIDYLCTHIFYTASLRTGKRVAGSISALNWQFKGVVSVSYNTIGGVWTLDSAGINKILADAVHNPRLTTWEQVTYRPFDFPPIDHSQNVTDFTGAADLVAGLNAIEAAIRDSAGGNNGGGGGSPVTKESIGLGNVQNYGIAQDADAQNPLSDQLYMTPKKTAETIDNYPGAPLTTFIARRDNPNAVTAAQTGAYTTAQTDAAINNLKTTLNATISNLSNTVTQHIANTANPHGTTAAQVGAYSKAEADALLLGKLDATAQANDSARWNGWDVATAMQQFKPDNAGNADTVGGMDVDELTASISATVAENVTTIDGKTLPEIEADIQTSVTNSLTGNTANPAPGQTMSGLLAKQIQYAATSDTVDPIQWMLMGYVVIDPSATAIEPDVELILTGGDIPTSPTSPLYQISMGSRMNSSGNVDMQVLNLRGADWKTINVDGDGNPVLQIGRRFSAGTGTTTNVELWIKTAGVRNAITVLDLSQDKWTVAPGIPQNTDPGSINYPVELMVATDADLAILETNLKAYVDTHPAILG